MLASNAESLAPLEDDVDHAKYGEGKSVTMLPIDMKQKKGVAER